MVKRARIGVYGNRTRSLQKRLSYEAVSLTWKIANVFMYLGSRDNVSPDVTDIQTTTFMEVPDRAYNSHSVAVNIYFEPAPEQVTDYSQFGIIDPIGTDQIIKMHVNSYDSLGRPPIVGDVVEVPFFKQDSHDALWEVTDVDRSQEFEKFYSVVKMRVLEDSRKTREIDMQGSIGDTLDDIMGQNENEANENVEHTGYDDTDVVGGNTNDDTDKPFDGTTQNDRDTFLDEFNGDLL